MISDEQKSQDAASDVSDFIQKALLQHEPLLLGSLLVIQGLGIFKSILDEAAYEELCIKIYSDRNRVIKNLN
jgi:hypothetical protein